MSDADHERPAVELVIGSTQYAETLDALRADSQAALTEMSAHVGGALNIAVVRTLALKG